MPAAEWMVRHAREKHAIDLARRVHGEHRVEVGPLTVNGEQAREKAEWLSIEELDNIVPLDGQFGVNPRKTVPDALRETLFGQVEPTEAEIAFYGGAEAVPPLRTYGIIDAAKIPLGGSVIERSGRPFRCLFKGEVARELGDVAPYLMELDIESDFTRLLFTYNPTLPDNLATAHLWHLKCGVFIRSRAGFDDLWQHFRRFTRIQDESGKWYYFRFWEPEHLVRRLEDDDLAQRLLVFDSNGTVLCPGKKTIHLIRKVDAGRPGIARPIKIAVDDVERDLRHSWLDRIADKIVASFPDHKLEFQKVRASAETSVTRMQGYGYMSENHLVILASWEVFYGERFETRDPDGELEAICCSGLPAIKKFNAFRKRMESLPLQAIGIE